MQAIAEGPQELAAGAGDEQLVELGEGDPVGLGVDVGSRHEMPEDAGAPHVDVGEAGLGEQDLELVDVEASRQWVGAPPPAGRIGERRASLPELARDRLGEDDREPARDEEREPTARTQGGGGGSQGRGRVVDDLERAVAADEVDLAVAEHRGEGVAVTLDPDDEVLDAGLTGAAAQCGERVRAGVDDRDVVSGLAERDGDTAGATTEVEHLEGALEVG